MDTQPTLRVVENDRRGPVVASAIVLAALTVLTLAELGNYSLRVLAPVTALVVATAVTYRTLLAWRSLVGLIVAVILLIPIKRYTFPSALPFHLEPYRLIVLVVATGWLTSLLVDPRVRLRRSPFDGLVLGFAAVVVVSLALNPHRVASVEPDVIKKLLFFASFAIVFFFVVSVVRGQEDVDLIVKILAGGGAVVAVAALVESRTGYNVFNHIRSVVPFVRQTASTPDLHRGARLRVFASAQHPIALSAALAMLLPLSVYLGIKQRQLRWWAASVVIGLGVLSATARTGVLMLLVVAIVYVWVRPRTMKRFWPALLPALVVVHVALPGAIGTFKSSFFPKGGLIAQQQNASIGSGRLATAGPVLRSEFRSHPVFGEGFGTRIVKPDEFVPRANAPILDDQWLGVLLETGIVGAFLLIWLFVRFVRRTGRAARDDPSPRGWLLAALSASVAAYGVSMFTYDAFSFVQVTFLVFIFLALGAATLRLSPDATEAISNRKGALASQV